jgi:protoporphyrinogen oxidase
MNIAIIGAGPAGLAAAYDLTKANHSVTIFEAAPQVGGLASGFKAPHWNWSLEKFYHHWFQTDKSILGLIDELGWSDDVLFPRPSTVIYYKGQFHQFDDMFGNMPIFLLKNFPIIDVIRFGLAGAYLRFSPYWQPLEKDTADHWTRKYFGENIYKLIWRPMLVGKFGEENMPIVNMAWLWARLHSRTTRLGTFKGGFQAFLDKLAEVVKKQGADIRLNSPVTGIRKNSSGAKNGGVTLESGGVSSTFDAVISTSSPALMAQISPDLPADYSAQLKALKSMGAVVLILSLRKQLTQYYWHNLPKEAGFPFLSLVEHTNYIGPENYGGDHIVYCGDYLEVGHEYFSQSKEELFERFLPALKRFNPEFDRDWVKDSWVFKVAYAQPIPPVDHSKNIPPLKTPLDGLYFASMSQVYPWDRGTNFAVEIGRRVARMVMDDGQQTLG